MASLVTSASWAVALVAMSAGMLAVTVLIVTDLGTVGWLLGGATVIGVGIAAAAFGVVALREGRVLLGTTVIGFGVAAAVFGVASVREGDLLFGTAFGRGRSSGSRGRGRGSARESSAGLAPRWSDSGSRLP
nr:hypothetical protein GCM10020092_001430 [Actinoplanes digitatis]